jgi:hypothetical protein
MPRAMCDEEVDQLAEQAIYEDQQARRQRAIALKSIRLQIRFATDMEELKKPLMKLLDFIYEEN